MIITWYGQSCFKLQSGEQVLVIDPFSKDIGLTPPRFRANLVLITHDHPDHNNAESIAENPMVISGPGEYDFQGIAVKGMQTYHDNAEGKERGLNTIYVIEMDDMKLCHMGDFGENELRPETAEAIGDVDILFVPVGGKTTINSEQAAKVVGKIEPRVVIPMHYKIPGLKVELENASAFLKEMGAKNTEPEEKLVIKQKDLPVDGTKVIVLKTP
ncbi:MBL fold metallo-hydrolase [Patescibacteria group bacterium]|nr:MBL fold metallo-hydrolase [Patescibacteria group bacterium]